MKASLKGENKGVSARNRPRAGTMKSGFVRSAGNDESESQKGKIKGFQRPTALALER